MKAWAPIVLVLWLAGCSAGEGPKTQPSDAGSAPQDAPGSVDAPWSEAGLQTVPTMVSAGACASQACSGVIPDLCCPAACSPVDDVDCGGCGNRRLEPGETCDPLESCPTACPSVGCNLRRMKSEGTCSAVCVPAGLQTACKSGDQCCPEGCNQANDQDCASSCGNAVVEPGELCDPVDTCPQTCAPLGCTLRRLEAPGSCLARCLDAGEQEQCNHGDGCCPAGCTTATDDDCAIVCGNGIKERAETCDPLSTCPTTDDCKPQGCRLRRLLNPGTCNAACVDDGLQSACLDGDGCCPTGCHAGTDSDCRPVCGNGQIEGGETCDPPSVCLEREKGCVGDAITARTKMGDVNACTFSCQEVARTCGPRDGACPAGCDAARDPDCPGCGNGVTEPNETCDPCDPAITTGCTSDMNVTRVLTGKAETCDLLCTTVPRMCAAGDGLCPAGCTRAQDPDCRFPGGFACKQDLDCSSGRCTDDRCCVQSCATCEACTGPGGTCVAIARGQEDAVPAGSCTGGKVCNGTGACLLANGVVCKVTTDCSSGFCTDGLCCDSACNGGCRSCALAASRGACAVVKGTEDVDTCAFADQRVCDDAGTCTTPSCKLTPSVLSHDYGAIAYGNGSAAYNVAFTNGCVGPVGPFSVGLAGAHPANFAITRNGCTGSLAAGRSCTVAVAFRPVALGRLTARLEVSTPDASASTGVQGNGVQGARLAFSPSPINFGMVTPGWHYDLDITITNSGTGPTGTLSLSLPGALYPVWTVRNNPCTNLAPGSKCVVTVRFAPSQYADYSAVIAISGPGGSARATMTGEGNVIVK